MDRFLLVLSALGTMTILCQWYVVTSIRTYLVGRYEPITRRFAYPALIALGLVNLAAVTLAFESPLFPPDTFGRKAAAVAFFSYLGIVLALCLFFLALGILCNVFDLAGNAKARVAGPQGHRLMIPAGERGCVSASPLNRGEPAAPREAPGTPPEQCSQPTAATDHNAFAGNPDRRPLSSLPPLSRRTFLKWSAAAGVVVTFGYGTHGIVEAYSPASVEEFELLHPRLRGLNRPITIVQITDFHFGLFCGTTELDKVVLGLNSIEADMVVFTGDMFHSPLSPVERAVPVLRRLKSRRLGNFAVMGNHDFYAGELRSVETLENSGLKLLRNQWVSFREGAAEVHLGGIDDPMGNWMWGKEFPGFTTFLSRKPERPGLTILLSHRPSIFPMASAAGLDFVLAGHIHGGQIILPGTGSEHGVSLARVVSPYTHGWYNMARSRMYLNRGVGLTFIPWRINCPPEIAVIHLAGTDQESPSVRRIAPAARLKV